MEDTERSKEKNIEALLQAGYAVENRLDPHLRAAMYGRLSQSLNKHPAFPPLALGLICAVLLILAIYMAAAATGIIPLSESDPLLYLTASALLLNFLCLPIASILIVIRRKHA
jgi:hypothetical protein